MAPLSDYLIQRRPPDPDGRDLLHPVASPAPERTEPIPLGKIKRSYQKKTPRIRSAEDEKPDRRDAVEKPAAALASPNERQTARDLLTKIGQEFADNRQKSKSKAFESYQRAVATNLGVLVMGGAITLKEGTVLLMDLEAFVKSTQKEGETPATVLGQFLRGELEVE